MQYLDGFVTVLISVISPILWGGVTFLSAYLITLGVISIGTVLSKVFQQFLPEPVVQDNPVMSVNLKTEVGTRIQATLDHLEAESPELLEDFLAGKLTLKAAYQMANRPSDHSPYPHCMCYPTLNSAN
jgi:hypothetical protein